MRRGESGLSMVVSVYKESGMTSHDVVSRVRRIFGERRVGHAGTLDPLAEGVLPILVGPATRLNKYLVDHDKRYLVDIVFGSSTTTDDAEGEVLRESSIPASAYDASFAKDFCQKLVGRSKQLPPTYSAIKVGGKKACDEARKGNVIDLQPRDIEVYSADLIRLGNVDAFDEAAPYGGSLFWTVRLHVSKGTYIRALARDVGAALNSCAHVGALRRESVGGIDANECLTLESLERKGREAAIDPLRLLGMRLVFIGDDTIESVGNGRPLPAKELDVLERWDSSRDIACCMSPIVKSERALRDGETLAVVSGRSIKAIYRYDEEAGLLRPDCVFQVGVSRGAGI